MALCFGKPDVIIYGPKLREAISKLVGNPFGIHDSKTVWECSHEDSLSLSIGSVKLFTRMLSSDYSSVSTGKF